MLNPNRKWTQLTVDCVQVMVHRLIKTRGSRRAVMGEDVLMGRGLAPLVALVEVMAPKLHNEAGAWRRMYHPYLYLRQQLERLEDREGEEVEGSASTGGGGGGATESTKGGHHGRGDETEGPGSGQATKGSREAFEWWGGGRGG